MSTESAQTDQSGPEVVEGERERSTIVFPYGDLEWGVKVAKGVHQVGGTSCQWEQLAAQLGMSPNGGAFRTNMLTSKIFGLITYSQGIVQLTPLGQRVSDPKQEKAAKADAFLAVPLYRAVYEKFKGSALPPPSALENEMGNMGVAKKQTDKARQAFQRSALQAGFFAFGQDRLVMPAVGSGAAAATKEGETGKPEDKQRTGDDGGGGARHPFIAGLLKELPNEGADWSTPDRVKWLKAAAMIFDLIYKNEDSGKPLKIEVLVDSAK